MYATLPKFPLIVFNEFKEFREFREFKEEAVLYGRPNP